MTAAISSFIAPPAPQASPSPAAPGPDKAFAQMLSQRQAMAHDAVAPKGADQPSNEPTAPQPAARRPAASQPQASERPKAEKAKVRANTEPVQYEVTSSADKTAAADSEPVDPAHADWLTALNLPAAPVATPATALAQGARTAGNQAEQPGAGGPMGKAGAQGVIDAAGQRGDAAQETTERLHAVRDSREKPDALAADTQTAASAWQAANERVNAPAEAPARIETPPIGALGAAQQTTSAARAAEPAATVTVSLPTPATAPEFAQSLGVQVSVLARDGVQQAELHLNPADMGPISVQIALEGTQAQVNFGADSAATRQIIESGLPELAAALRDAGFTLSGGGVQGQARGRGEGGDSADGRGAGQNGSQSEAEVTPRRVTTRVSAGGVDLYA
jgi:flagellar hook-length control protein FliK